MSQQEKHAFTRTSLFWLMTIAFLYAIIFYFSSRNGSQSSMQSQKVLDLLHLQDTQMMTFLIRKAAHFCIYALLSLCAYQFFSSLNCSPQRSFWLSISACFLLAAADEWHQSFVPGRSAEFRDVLIDTCGCLIGAWITQFLPGHSYSPLQNKAKDKEKGKTKDNTKAQQ